LGRIQPGRIIEFDKRTPAGQGKRLARGRFGFVRGADYRSTALPSEVRIRNAAGFRD
jgi:hypothetical protein